MKEAQNIDLIQTVLLHIVQFLLDLSIVHVIKDFRGLPEQTGILALLRKRVSLVKAGR